MKKTLLSALISIALFSCQSGSNEPAPVQEEDKQLVQSVTTVETSAGKSTRTVLTYEYDNSNRMTALHERYDDHAGPNSDHVYTYDGQGNLTRSTINREGTVSIFDYTYKDGAPFSVAYTMPANASDFHSLAITTANGVVTNHVITTVPSEGKATVVWEYAKGNNTAENNSHFTSSGVKDFFANFNREYGSKKNPYLYSGYKWMLPDMPYANKNELIESSSVNNAGTGSVTAYTNTYDSNNYPISVQASTTGGFTSTSTITYTYIKAK
ncbi:hypothetical protein [Mucilaginibacter pedocola]|uniref:DUF4595 domain-containing protein n=1 Tax=Mucilaginibacter pedocola TaxID=1792845 RepID=A0A1S9PLT7_9SPHI|nr:hypothetical protein [Mucilaginibacter pedocola]OOQ61901.1 hypothetical protein BC343_02225 [Mucilaginibacter pedocola]